MNEIERIRFPRALSRILMLNPVDRNLIKYAPSRLTAEQQAKRQQVIASSKFLLELGKLFCEKDAEVTIVQCGAGEGEEGKELQRQIKSMFGGNVKVPLFEGMCGFSLGTPVTMSPTAGKIFE